MCAAIVPLRRFFDPRRMAIDPRRVAIVGPAQFSDRRPRSFAPSPLLLLRLTGNRLSLQAMLLGWLASSGDMAAWHGSSRGCCWPWQRPAARCRWTGTRCGTASPTPPTDRGPRRTPSPRSTPASWTRTPERFLPWTPAPPQDVTPPKDAVAPPGDATTGDSAAACLPDPTVACPSDPAYSGFSCSGGAQPSSGFPGLTCMASGGAAMTYCCKGNWCGVPSDNPCDTCMATSCAASDCLCANFGPALDDAGDTACWDYLGCIDTCPDSLAACESECAGAYSGRGLCSRDRQGGARLHAAVLRRTLRVVGSGPRRKTDTEDPGASQPDVRSSARGGHRVGGGGGGSEHLVERREHEAVGEGLAKARGALPGPHRGQRPSARSAWTASHSRSSARRPRGNSFSCRPSAGSATSPWPRATAVRAMSMSAFARRRAPRPCRDRRGNRRGGQPQPAAGVRQPGPPATATPGRSRSARDAARLRSRPSPRAPRRPGAFAGRDERRMPGRAEGDADHDPPEAERVPTRARPRAPPCPHPAGAGPGPGCRRRRSTGERTRAEGGSVCAHEGQDRVARLRGRLGAQGGLSAAGPPARGTTDRALRRSCVTSIQARAARRRLKSRAPCQAEPRSTPC